MEESGFKEGKPQTSKHLLIITKTNNLTWINKKGEDSGPFNKKIRLDEELEDLNENNSINLKGALLNLTHTVIWFFI